MVEQGAIIRDEVVADAANNSTTVVEQEQPVIDDELVRPFSAVEQATRMHNRILEVTTRNCIYLEAGKEQEEE